MMDREVTERVGRSIENGKKRSEVKKKKKNRAR
jgi:hypothetical protein